MIPIRGDKENPPHIEENLLNHNRHPNHLREGPFATLLRHDDIPASETTTISSAVTSWPVSSLSSLAINFRFSTFAARQNGNAHIRVALDEGELD